MTTIIELRAQGYRRLSAVAIRPDGGPVVVLKGRNGQGKTSILNAIATALGGKDLAPKQPIKNGEDRAEISLTLSNGAHVTRRFWRGKSGAIESDLKVEIENATRQKPQAYLTDMVGDLAFNPLEFATRLKPAEQFAILADMVKGFDIAKHESEQRRDFSARTIENRSAADARAAAAQIQLPPGPMPDAVNVGALMAEAQDAARHNAEIDRREQRLQQLDDELELAEAVVAKLKRQREELAAAPAARRIDFEALQKRAADAHETNRVRELHLRRNELLDKASAAEAAADALTRQMQQREEKKKAAIAAAALPVPGLGLEDGAVTLNGLPFEQASGAEQLRTSIAIGMARNPKLRVMLVDEASSLDAEQLAVVEQMADAGDYQVWLVRVADGSAGGFVIEDGAVAG